MSARDAGVLLAQMRDHAHEALQLTEGRSREDLDADRVLSLALVRLLEIIGEAASRVPESDRSSCSDVPWRQLVALRNRLIHAYDQVDLDILWQILTADLPTLAEVLDKALQDRSG